MRFPDIDKVAFTIPNVPVLGDLSVHWYGIMYLVGFVAAMFIANRAADKPDSGWTREQVSDLLFYGFLGVILGGRLGYVLFYQFPQFIGDPLYLFRIQDGGMSFHGGLLGVTLALYYFARKTNKQFLDIGDFAAPLIPIGLGAGRIGNFINDELWGRTTDVPWAIIFPNGGELPRHPSMLYEFFLEGVVLFIVLMWYRSKPRPQGSVGALFLVCYGIFRILVEFVRQPDAHLVHPIFNYITMGQILSLPMIAIGGWIMYRGHKNQQVSVGSV